MTDTLNHDITLPPDYSKKVRNLYLVVAATMVVIAWGAVAYETWFKERDPREEFDPTIFVVLAGITSVGAIIVTPILIKRKLYLAENGVRVTATFVSESLLGKHGSGTMKYRYEWEGQTIESKCDMTNESIAAIKQAGTLDIMVDPDKPHRNAPLEDLIPERWRVQPEDTSSE